MPVTPPLACPPTTWWPCGLQRPTASGGRHGDRQVQGLLPEKFSRVFFPGSQPVSLARANMGLLRQRRYWVTWKADGTRYMLLLCHWGVTCPAQPLPSAARHRAFAARDVLTLLLRCQVYVIDRSFQIRRVQVQGGFAGACLWLESCSQTGHQQ